MDTIVGRASELERVDALLDRDDTSPAALVLEGEPGIGKTTIWRVGVEHALARSHVVLRAEPAENEQALPFAALVDLLDSGSRADRPALPDDVRRALQHVEAGGGAAEDDLLGISRAVLSLVRALAEAAPLTLAIDDAQWLDRATATVLEYVLRRCGDVPLRALLAQRVAPDDTLPVGLERVPAPFAVERAAVPPMSVGDLDELLRGTLGLALPRPRLVELAGISAGNPFYALEVARGLAAAGQQAQLHVPGSLGAVLRPRVDALDPAARRAALLAAASIQPSTREIEAAAGADALRTAIAGGILVAEGARLRFSHPLLATVVYESAFPAERQEAHLCLAAADVDADERAYHLARGTSAPDEQVADTLEQAAARLAARGDPGRAADLARAAERLTLPDDLARLLRRRLAVAEHLVAAGDPAGARELLELMIAERPAGPARAELLWRLADTIGDTLDEPIRLCEQALVEAGDDPMLLADVHTALATFTWLAGDLARSTEHVRATSTCARAAGDPRREAIAIGEMCHAEAVLGVPWGRRAMERALSIERRLGGMPATLAPSFQLAVISLYTDEHDRARPTFEAALERAAERGDEPTRATTLFRLTELELRAGRFGHGLRYAREAAGLARQAGIEQEQYVTAMALASALAHVGQLAEARALATRAHAVATSAGDRIVATRLAGILGFVELSDASVDDALGWLTPGRVALQEMGTGELSISGIVQNEIEALVIVGRLDEAEEVIRFTERHGTPTGRAWHAAVAARGTALVAAARGDTDAALESLATAYAAHERLPQPFELARTRLAEGRIARRGKRQAQARVALTAALEAFDQLGAAVWAGFAASELARVAGRRPASGELTEMERRVAELVAQGHTNKEAAAILFVSVRTVESNLTRVYGKLGIRSRTELARRPVDVGGV